MFTTDLALKFDPSYRKIAKRLQENPEEYQRAFAKACFKLTHHDLGPRARYLGTEVPSEVLAWQDPVPAVDHPLIDANGARIRLAPQKDWTVNDPAELTKVLQRPEAVQKDFNRLAGADS